MLRTDPQHFLSVFLSPILLCMAAAPAASQDVRFEISFPDQARAEPVTGRVYVMISRTAEREPRVQIGKTGAPFFGRDVEHLAPGEKAVIDHTDLGSPVPNLREIPPAPTTCRLS